jgi:phosphate uptake regulator
VFWEITKQQLLAHDLRRMVFYLNTTFHLCRLTDYLKKIFLFFSGELNEKQKVNPFFKFKEITQVSLQMMRQVFFCIKQFSSEKAIEVAKIDHKIDALYNENIKNIVSLLLQEKNISEEKVMRIVRILQIVKYFER